MDDQHEWEDWPTDLVKAGADALGVHPVGEPAIGWRGRSVGCRVASDTGERWLRVVCEPGEWASGPAWTGNVDANDIVGVVRPRTLDVAEWNVDARRARAELMVLAPGAVASSEIVIRDQVKLEGDWWASLRASLDALAAFPTDRVCLDADLLRMRVLAAFGVEVDLATVTWSTAHGDLHWANLTAPQFALLDWESWGRAPAGYDAATLYCASLLQPDLAERVATTFADLLDSPSGRIARLAAAAKLLRLVEYGDHPDLAPVLHRQMRALVSRAGTDLQEVGRVEHERKRRAAVPRPKTHDQQNIGGQRIRE
jgi:hypothetical protein